MTKSSKRTRLGRIWAGAIWAVVGGWLAFTLFSIFYIWTRLHPNWPGFAALTFALTLLYFPLLPAIGFAMGLVASFFWHPVADRVTCERWGAPVTLCFLAPLLVTGIFLSALSIGIAVAAFLLMLVSFHRAIGVGSRWWREDGWRRFWGLSNEWEREPDSE